MLFIIQSMEMQNSVGVSMQPCRTTVVVGNGEDSLPPFLTLEDVPV